ncbi:unnamed protein product [Heterobilharzia americana]|nr:unnamed protein product [Heterobilharzia americana]
MYIIPSLYDKLTNCAPTGLLHSRHSFFPESINSPAYLLNNQMYPINSVIPSRQVATSSCRNSDLFYDNFSYKTSNLGQLFEENVMFSKHSAHNNINHDGNDADGDAQPKLNFTDPLMTDIAVGELDNSPNSSQEFEMLLIPPSSLSTSSSSSSLGYISGHPSSMCSTPTETEFFNSSASSLCSSYSNNNNSNNSSVNSNLASSVECGSSSSSSSSTGSCCSFQPQQPYNGVKHSDLCDNLFSRSINSSTTSTTTVSNSIATTTSTGVNASNGLVKLVRPSYIHVQNRQHEELCLMSSKNNGKPVWQMKFGRKQHVYNHTMLNNTSSPSFITRFRFHHHHHQNQYINHQSRRRFTLMPKKPSYLNDQVENQMYNIHSTQMHYDYSPSPAIQLTNQNITNYQEQNIHYSNPDLSAYTFQLSPSIPDSHHKEKPFCNNNNNNSGNTDNVMNNPVGRKDNFLHSIPLRREKHEFASVRSSPLPSLPTTSITDMTHTTTATGDMSSVMCKSPSRNYCSNYPLSPPNPVQKRLHLLQFISKILQYSSESSSLFTSCSTASSPSSTSSSTHPTSTLISSVCSSTMSPASTSLHPGSQQDQFILHLFTPNSQFLNCVQWIDKQARIFQIRNPQKLSQLWGYYRKNENMTFESVSRSLRLYYVSGKLERIRGQRNQYRFLDVNI